MRDRKEARSKYVKRLLAIMAYSFALGVASAPVLFIIMMLMQVTDPEYQKLLSYLTGLFIYLNYTLPETLKAAAEFAPKGEDDAVNPNPSNDDSN